MTEFQLGHVVKMQFRIVKLSLPGTVLYMRHHWEANHLWVARNLVHVIVYLQPHYSWLQVAVELKGCSHWNVHQHAQPSFVYCKCKILIIINFLWVCMLEAMLYGRCGSSVGQMIKGKYVFSTVKWSIAFAGRLMISVLAWCHIPHQKIHQCWSKSQYRNSAMHLLCRYEGQHCWSHRGVWLQVCHFSTTLYCCPCNNTGTERYSTNV